MIRGLVESRLVWENASSLIQVVAFVILPVYCLESPPTLQVDSVQYFSRFTGSCIRQQGFLRLIVSNRSGRGLMDPKPASLSSKPTRTQRTRCRRIPAPRIVRSFQEISRLLRCCCGQDTTLHGVKLLDRVMCRVYFRSTQLQASVDLAPS